MASPVSYFRIFVHALFPYYALPTTRRFHSCLLLVDHLMRTLKQERHSLLKLYLLSPRRGSFSPGLIHSYLGSAPLVRGRENMESTLPLRLRLLIISLFQSLLLFLTRDYPINLTRCLALIRQSMSPPIFIRGE